MEKRIFTLLFTLFIGFAAVAQDDCTPREGGKWKWPEDKAKAQEQYTLYTDYLKQKNYEQAQVYHTWILENAIDLNKSNFINGAKIYGALADKESDPARKAVLADSLLLMYDLRASTFVMKQRMRIEKPYMLTSILKMKSQGTRCF